MKKQGIIIFLLLFFIEYSHCEVRLSLNSNEIDRRWTVRNLNNSIDITAWVPGGIYTDLKSAGILDDNLFYRFNDINYRWVGKETWTYNLDFDLPEEVLEKRAINLVFHGIDTVADVILNGVHVSSVNNMFVRHVIPVKALVQKKNKLEVTFKSPILEAVRLAGKQRRSYPIPPECVPQSYNGECHVNLLRKMQASFSWDWGPAFPSVGLWKSVEIEAFDFAVIRDVSVESEHLKDLSHWLVHMKYYVEYADENTQPYKTFVSLTDIHGGENLIKDQMPINETVDHNIRNGYVHSTNCLINDKQIQVWWPNGFGNSTLYKLSLHFQSKNGTEFTTKTIKIGFRTVELVEEPIHDDQPGLTFYFKVNGRPIFAKGSNWIPGHILPELGYDEFMVREMLLSAKKTHMNMLRVWGGGVYESDVFYEIADELGILIWQDMMFACAMYPADVQFLNNVKTEIRQQVRRLQHHPSIALWAGNNENEAALRGNWYNTRVNYTTYYRDYVSLYENTIKTTVYSNDESRTYVLSSPSNGKKTIEEGFIANNPYSSLYGDVHYYNYVLNGWDSHHYPDTRFASEYGFQSMPSYQSMAEVSLPEDRALGTEFTRKRQHLPDGNIFLLHQIENQLPLPTNDGSEDFYKTFIYYSQISQAMSVKAETEKYRRDRNKLTDQNVGLTMGALYWQLNDVWQAPSWSSIEFGGKWKMLHYYAKKFFSPVLVSPEETLNNSINVYLISDLWENVLNVSLRIHVYSWDDFNPKKIHSYTIRLKREFSELHSSHSLETLFTPSNCTRETCFLYFTLEGPQISTDNVVFPRMIRFIKNLRKPNLTVEINETSDPRRIQVTVITDRIAPFVWLETEEPGQFSDNGFLLLRPRAVLEFRNLKGKPVNVNKLSDSLKVRSLY